MGEEENRPRSFRIGPYGDRLDEAVARGRYRDYSAVVQAGLQALFDGPASFPPELQDRLEGLSRALKQPVAVVVERLIDRYGRELLGDRKA